MTDVEKSKYLVWDEVTITDFSDKSITNIYEQGYVFTRISKGVMQQTRSVRINLSEFKLSSENRRILRNAKNVQLEIHKIPYNDYTWEIGKLAKDFYSKFGEKTFSANKIKEILCDQDKSNFNTLFSYSDSLSGKAAKLGYAICYMSEKFLHYSYPFYSLGALGAKDTGLGMMTRAIIWAHDNAKQYIYLGSATRPTDTYKLQFSGLEWFDGEKWNTNTSELKQVLSTIPAK